MYIHIPKTLGEAVGFQALLGVVMCQGAKETKIPAQLTLWLEPQTTH